MKTQISKHSYEPGKRYSGVYQQQGRMITDADWNELVELLKERLNDALKDVINDGAPRDRGVAIEAIEEAIGIRTGHLYVDGIKAELPGNGELILFGEQVDFPGAPVPDADAVIYADVWEKTVVSLEDDDMRDPGLHGADTCSRTQTLAQIKSCAAGIDPETDATLNPTIGNARVEVRLWEESDADSERADPCITEVAENPRIGNYLFRVEVHDISMSHAEGITTATLTLKWSEENGAEHHGLVWRDNNGIEKHGYDAVPGEFGAEDWVYEFYTDKSERHLGHQLNSNFTPARGKLEAILDRSAELPTIDGEMAQYIRRWDGNCKIDLTRSDSDAVWVPDTESLDGEDKRQNLRISELPGHGNVHFNQDESGNYRITIHLEKLILSFHLDGNDFLAGDYWLAVVREDAPYYADADPVIDQRITTLNNGVALGIRHHYLKLADIVAGEIQPYPPGSPQARRMSFPPLTDISADRISYDADDTQDRWDDINDDGSMPPNTVQEAIDDLVDNLESSDIAYTPPVCETGGSTEPPTLKDLLGVVARTDLKSLWDGLLCEFDAGKVPFTNPCTDVFADANTVQGALDAICNRDSGTLAYTPPTDCTLYPSTVTTVSTALNALCEIQAEHVGYGVRPDQPAPSHPGAITTVEEAVDYLLEHRGGGLAGILEALANAVALSGEDAADDETNVKPVRQEALFESPVDGPDSLFKTLLGMVLDAARTVYTIALEYLDVGEVGPVNGGSLGHSGGLSLSTLSTSEGYVAMWRRIREKLILAEEFFDNELLRVIAHSAAYVIGQRLKEDPAGPEDPVQVLLDRFDEMEPSFGTDDSWNGHVLRKTLLEGLYQPIIGTQWLDHNATPIIQQLLLDFIERLWHELSQRLLLETLPELPHPTGEEWLEKIGILLEAIKRATSGDGLVSSFRQRLGFERIEDLIMQPGSSDYAGASWLLGSKVIAVDERLVHVLSRISHDAVLEAFEAGELEMPAPDLNLMPSREHGWSEFLDARVSAGILHLDVRTESGDVQCTLPPSELSDLSGDLLMFSEERETGRVVAFMDAVTGKEVKALPVPAVAVVAPIDYAMHRIIDGETGELVYFSHAELSAAAPVVTLACSNWKTTYSTKGEFSIGGYKVTGLQGVYSLSQEKPAQGSHVLAVLDTEDGQLVALLQGVDEAGAPAIPWWTSNDLEPIVTLHFHEPGYRVLGAAHDQLVIEHRSSENPDRVYWMLVPFRAMHESLFGGDAAELERVFQIDAADSIPHVQSIYQDEQYKGSIHNGKVHDFHAGIDPWLSIMIEETHRRFYRCFNGVFATLDIELPTGKTGNDPRQCVHQFIHTGAVPRLLSLATSGTDVEYQLVNLADDIT